MGTNRDRTVRAPRDRAQWLGQLRTMQEMATRIREARRHRMDLACQAAGLGAYHGCTLHNALVGHETGRPWPNVDYSKARLARRLERMQFDGSRLVDSWYSRTYREAVGS